MTERHIVRVVEWQISDYTETPDDLAALVAPLVDVFATEFDQGEDISDITADFIADLLHWYRLRRLAQDATEDSIADELGFIVGRARNNYDIEIKETSS